MAAARVFGWVVIHYFDTRKIWVVNVERVLTVAADFGAVEFGGAIDAEVLGSVVGTFHAEREMILYAAFLLIGAGRDVQHEFDPFFAIGDLNFVPVISVC